MYLKVAMRHNPAGGKFEGYFRLVESYRNEYDRVCHCTLLNVGFLDGAVTTGQLNLIRRKLVNRYRQAQGIVEMEFPEEAKIEAEPVVNHLIEDLWGQLVSRNRIDTGQQAAKPVRAKDSEPVSLRHRDVREIGSEWLCCKALEQLR